MRENKRQRLGRYALAAAGFAVLLTAGRVLLPSPAASQNESTESAMYGVREVVIQKPRFGNPATAKACGLTVNEMSETLRKTLQQNGVPAMSYNEAPPANMTVARIYLIPEVYSYNSASLDCTSWVSLWAESRNQLRVPPVDMLRNVTIAYWHQGILLTSSQTTHDAQVLDGVGKLAVTFAGQFKTDQPPPPPYQP